METQMQRVHSSVVAPKSLSQGMGLLGIFMPLILVLGTFLFAECKHIQDSISHYYFTIMGSFLVGVLCAFSVILFTYKGYSKWDNRITSLAGFFALGIAFFATSQNPDFDCSVCCLTNCGLRVALHYASAALFFVTLSVISMFFFTRTDKNLTFTRRKSYRNRVYIICGIVMIVALALILMLKIFPWFNQHLGFLKPVFWLEWIALAAFGVSWYVKGGGILADK